MTFYVNGSKLLAVMDDSFASGKVGFTLYNNRLSDEGDVAEVLFDNVLVRDVGGR